MVWQIRGAPVYLKATLQKRHNTFYSFLRRPVLDTKPVMVGYQITDFGKTPEPIIYELAKWGIAYRDFVYNKKK